MEFGVVEKEAGVVEVDADAVFGVVLLGLPAEFAGMTNVGTADDFDFAEGVGVAREDGFVVVVAFDGEVVMVAEFVHYFVVLPVTPVGYVGAYFFANNFVETGEEHFPIHIKYERRVHTILRLSVNPIFQSCHNRLQKYDFLIDNLQFGLFFVILQEILMV